MRRSSALGSCGLEGLRRSGIALHLALRAGPTGVAEQGRAGILAVQRLGQLLDSLALLVGEFLGHLDLDPVIDVTATRPLGVRWALPPQPLDGTVLGAGSDSNRLRAVQGRYLDRCPLDRLRDRDR